MTPPRGHFYIKVPPGSEDFERLRGTRCRERRIQRLVVRRGEFQVQGGTVVADMFERTGAGDRAYPVASQYPRQPDLRGTRIVPLGDLPQRGVLQHPGLLDRRIR